MVKDLKEKLDKYDNEKKGAAKVEKAKREAVASRQEQEKKWAVVPQNALHFIKYLWLILHCRELEDKLQKVQLQFEKAAIESKRLVWM